MFSDTKMKRITTLWLLLKLFKIRYLINWCVNILIWDWKIFFWDNELVLARVFLGWRKKKCHSNKGRASFFGFVCLFEENLRDPGGDFGLQINWHLSMASLIPKNYTVTLVSDFLLRCVPFFSLVWLSSFALCTWTTITTGADIKPLCLCWESFICPLNHLVGSS